MRPPPTSQSLCGLGRSEIQATLLILPKELTPIAAPSAEPYKEIMDRSSPSPLILPHPSSSALSGLTGFSGNDINRMAHLRGDEEALNRAYDASKRRALVMADDRPLLRYEAGALSCYFGRHELLELATVMSINMDRAEDAVFLGADAQGAPLFAFDAKPRDISTSPFEFIGGVEGQKLGASHFYLGELRPLADHKLLPRSELAVLSEAKSLLNWHRRHGFCAQCGAATHARQGGWRRDCMSCETSHFPRTDPVVIMLAYQNDLCLMGRQPRFPVGMYSALAGFLEPGETIEEAVRREIMEEAGVRIGRVDYIASQPWPFPSSLMIGCFAHALSMDIHIDKTELEDARWFSRDEVKRILAGEHQELISPRPTAIAHSLMQQWCMLAP